jgi:hypothetical protein
MMLSPLSDGVFMGLKLNLCKVLCKVQGTVNRTCYLAEYVISRQHGKWSIYIQ